EPINIIVIHPMIDQQPTVNGLEGLRPRPDFERIPHPPRPRPDNYGVLLPARELHLVHVSDPHRRLDAMVQYILALNFLREHDGVLIPYILEGQAFPLPGFKPPRQEIVYLNGSSRDLSQITVICGVKHPYSVADE